MSKSERATFRGELPIYPIFVKRTHNSILGGLCRGSLRLFTCRWVESCLLRHAQIGQKSLEISLNLLMVSGLVKVALNDCLTMYQMNDNLSDQKDFKSIKYICRSKYWIFFISLKQIVIKERQKTRFRFRILFGQVWSGTPEYGQIPGSASSLSDGIEVNLG